MGDAILQTPLPAILKARFPGAAITLVATKITREIFRYNSNIDAVIAYNHNGRESISVSEFLRTLVLPLSAKKYDLALLDGSGGKLRGNLLSLILGARYIVSDGVIAPENNFIADEIVVYDHELHQAERNAAILGNSVTRISPLNPGDVKPGVEISARENRKADDFFRRHGIKSGDQVIALNPGSSRRKGKYKRWPTGKYLELVKLLREAFPGHNIIVIKGPSEVGIDYQGFFEKNCLIVEDCSILEVAAILRRASVYIGNDSGIAHLAASQDIPTIVIFGPTDERLIRPFGKHVRVISRDMACRPCWGGAEYLEACQGQLDCLTSIRSKTVLAAVKRCLAQVAEKDTGIA